VLAARAASLGLFDPVESGDDEVDPVLRPEGALAEQLEDLARSASVTALFREAREGTDLDRVRFRRVARFVLDEADRDVRHEWHRAVLDGTDGWGWWRAGRDAADAGERDRVVDRARTRARRGIDYGLERRAARDRVARETGASDAVDLVWGGATEAALGLLESFERVAIAPLDDTVLAVAADRGRRVPGRARIGAQAADEPWLEDLARHAAHLPADRIPRILIRTASRLGFDPDAGRGAIHEIVPGRTRVLEAQRPRPTVRCSRADAGPAALSAALGALGRGVRAAVVRERRGDGAAWLGDPAFSVAVDVLFRRLPLTPSFAADAGLPGYEAWVHDLAFEEAVRPRRDAAWARLTLDPPTDVPARFEERMARAAGRPPWPLALEPLWRGDPCGFDRLRGTVLGLLVEERLWTRFGTRWFADRGAARWLTEVWEAEPDATAESMAEQMSVGRMEPTPILDRCRPVSDSGAGTR
jgi:hypothetical protein